VFDTSLTAHEKYQCSRALPVFSRLEFSRKVFAVWHSIDRLTEAGFNGRRQFTENI
jgi:hypothetical protein